MVSPDHADMLANEANRLAAISQAHVRAARDNAVAGFRDAVRSGAYLLEIKRRVGHGNWLPWLEANFCQSVSTAEAYMLLAKEPVWLTEYVNSQSTGSLTLVGALKFIRAKRRAQKE